MKLFKKKFKDEIVDIDISTLETESGNRMADLPAWTKKFIALIAVAWTLFQLYTAFFGLAAALIQRSTTLSFGLVLCFLCFKFKKNDKNKVPIYDWLLAALAVVIPVYFVVTFDTLVMRGGNPTTMDVVLGVVLIVLVMEATRRSVGLPLVIVAGAFLVYAFTGPYMPGLIAHRGYSVSPLLCSAPSQPAASRPAIHPAPPLLTSPPARPPMSPSAPAA